MSDNDVAIEMGLIDVHGNILVDDDPEESYGNSSPMSEEYSSETMEVSLTPGKYLDTEGEYLRSQLTNNQLSDSEIKLEVMHDRYNENDPLALQVFCNHSFIGFIQKYDNEQDVDGFSFIDNEKIINLTLKWQCNCFILLRKLSHSESGAFESNIRKEKRREEIKLQEEFRAEEAREKERRDEELIVEGVKISKKRNDDLRMHQNALAAVKSVEDYPTIGESIGGILGRDIGEKRAGRTYDKLKRLESVDEDNAIYSTIEFFGGDSDKLKQVWKQEIIDEEKHPIMDFIHSVIGIVAILAVLYFALM